MFQIAELIAATWHRRIKQPPGQPAPTVPCLARRGLPRDTIPSVAMVCTLPTRVAGATADRASQSRPRARL